MQEVYTLAHAEACSCEAAVQCRISSGSVQRASLQRQLGLLRVQPAFTHDYRTVVLRLRLLTVPQRAACSKGKKLNVIEHLLQQCSCVMAPQLTHCTLPL
eukprot:3977-Heterococcus_DN1.PRE.1